MLLLILDVVARLSHVSRTDMMLIPIGYLFDYVNGKFQF